MNPLLVVDNLSKQFRLNRYQTIQAVRDISFQLAPGEILGLGGESGCGKSTIGKLILRLMEPSQGKVFFDRQDLFKLSPSALKTLRQEMQMVFQHPAGSLNPRWTIQDILLEPFEIHRLLTLAQRLARLRELLQLVGLTSAFLSRLPHELSGGQKQRIALARALALKPRLLVLDEPFSALDMSIQGQLIRLLKDLHRTLQLSYILISHDLPVMRSFTHRLGIMYLGSFVELGPSQAIYEKPLHPYTQALLAAVPTLDVQQRKPLHVLKGELPSLLHPPSGCPFHTRCPAASAICREKKPVWQEIKPQHFVACHLYSI